MANRREFSDEYKREAVRMATQLGVKKSQIADELGINANLLGRWCKDSSTNGGSAFPVRMMCRCLRVSPSGYCGWHDRPASLRKQANERLLVRIRSLHAESDGVFGSPRMRDELRYLGETQPPSCGSVDAE